MAATKKPEWDFDNQKLEKLSEPITVTVNKIVGAQKEPVILPIKPEESVPGKGWTQDDIRTANLFLRDKWCGGGTYEVTAVGANGEKMQWKPFFPESKYPVLQEGKLIQQAPSNGQSTGLAGAQQQAATTPNNGFFGSFAAPQVQPQQLAQQPQWLQGQAQNPWGGNGGGPSGYWPNHQPGFHASSIGGSFDRGGSQSVQQEREERLKLEAKIDRERLENRYKEQLGEVARQMAEMQRELSKPKGESDETKLLRQQLEEQKRQQSEDKLVTMIQAMQQQTQQQIAAMQQAMQAKPSGPDPVMMMVVESMKSNAQSQADATRMQMEANKEIARMQMEAQKAATQNAMGPRDMMDFMSRMSVGQEQLAGAYGKVWELMQQGLETILTAQGPAPHPAMELVGQAAQGGLEVAQRYIQMKEQSALAEAQAKHAQAQAAAMQAQAGMPQAQQLQGAQDTVDEDGEDQVEAPAPAEVANAERELFGPAIVAVNELRRRVESGEATPELAAQMLIQGIDHYVTQGAEVPAFELWASGELGKLVECLIPDARPSYKEQLSQKLFEIRTAMQEQLAKQQGG